VGLLFAGLPGLDAGPWPLPTDPPHEASANSTIATATPPAALTPTNLLLVMLNATRPGYSGSQP